MDSLLFLLDHKKKKIKKYNRNQPMNFLLKIKHDDSPEDPLSWGHFEFFSTSKRHYTDKKHKTIRAKNGDLASISQYFNGDIYRYAIINSDDELEDSLCGIYGLDGIREVLKDQQGIEIPKI